MQKIAYITSIYKEFWGTKIFRESCAHCGIEPINVHKGEPWKGNANVFKLIYKALVELREAGYTHVVYSDGADVIWLEKVETCPDFILYSTEKAFYPNAVGIGHHYSPEHMFPKDSQTRWHYLNAGLWLGSIDNVIAHYQLNKLHSLPLHYPNGQVLNGQWEQICAYFCSLQSMIPIALDSKCNFFQSVAFQHDDEFTMPFEASYGIRFRNEITGNYPLALHGNGRTDMSWIVDRLDFITTKWGG